MRIGFFTDTYLPVTNGISYVIQILKKDLEDAGHEVWIFAPRDVRWKLPKEDHIIRYPALGGLFYEDQFNTFVFPPGELKRIEDLKLDILVGFTPSFIGALGAYISRRTEIPYVIQYGTDLERYAELYKPAAIGAIVGSLLLGPYYLKMNVSETLNFYKGFFGREDKNMDYCRYATRHMLKIVHRQASAVIATSEKTAQTLRAWPLEQNISVIPTGVDRLAMDASFKKSFTERFGIKKDDEVILYVGRMSSEKNLEMLINSFGLLAAKRPRSKLLMVGDFQHRWKLEDIAAKTNYQDRIIFTGQVNRTQLGTVYALADVFAFPSLTDCQALVLNEAALAQLPLVWCDNQELNPVLEDGVSGLKAGDDERDFAEKLIKILSDDKLRKKLGRGAQNRASNFTEQKQTDKFLALLREVSIRQS